MFDVVAQKKVENASQFQVFCVFLQRNFLHGVKTKMIVSINRNVGAFKCKFVTMISKCSPW